MARAETTKAFSADPYVYAEARELADELDLSEPVAITLVRRGYRTPAAARAFLDAEETHHPFELEGMRDVCDRILGAVAEGRRITVHGDFDVDGVCATAIAVSTLRELGADCDWLIPERLGDGYGLSAPNVERLAARGTSLILTVDCAITAVEEVALARSLGMEVVVTDHHQPKAELPDCPIIHPRICGYPYADLCGTAVSWKLASALRRATRVDTAEAKAATLEEAASLEEDDLDLVALATVADLVPLTGENRNLVRRGLSVARRAERPGLHALALAAGCEPSRLDESDLGFRLGPRINAAGRLYRADAGVELMLTADRERAGAIAQELDRANMERRFTEREVANAAQAALRELPEDQREGSALVLAGTDWHPGVVGIVASRLAEEHHRPAILLSIDGEGRARGSGRSIPGFDLLAGLEACSEHLTRFGGHRAAAGMELPAGGIEAFRKSFLDHAATVIGPDGLARTERIDAVVGGSGIGMSLAQELCRLAPFGNGNPGVRLLVPSARVRDVRGMGQEGRHSRFSLHSGSHRALGVAFGRSSLAVKDDDAVDAAVRLEVNEWNGALEPRLVLRELYPLETGTAPASGAASSPHACRCGAQEWWERFERELAGDFAEPAIGEAPQGSATPQGSEAQGSEAQGSATHQGIEAPERTSVSHGSSAAAVLAELVSSGERVLAVCADAARRAGLAEGSAGLARFGSGRALVVCGRCAAADPDRLADGSEMLILTDYAALGLAPTLPALFAHVVLIDPPASVAERETATRAGSDRGFVHPVWEAAEQGFALTILEEQAGLRMPLRSAFRDLRECEASSGEALRSALAGTGRYARSPELAGRCVRVLRDLALVSWEPNGMARTLGAVSSQGTQLERSEAFRAYAARHEEGQRYLERLKQP